MCPLYFFSLNMHTGERREYQIGEKDQSWKKAFFLLFSLPKNRESPSSYSRKGFFSSNSFVPIRAWSRKIELPPSVNKILKNRRGPFFPFPACSLCFLLSFLPRVMGCDKGRPAPSRWKSLAHEFLKKKAIGISEPGLNMQNARRKFVFLIKWMESKKILEPNFLLVLTIVIL